MWSNLRVPFQNQTVNTLPGAERYLLLGDIVTILLSSEDSSGQLTLHEVSSVYRDGVAMRIHTHPEQTQYFRVMEGEIGYQVGDRRGVARAGDVVVMPAGVPHRTWTAQPGESRTLVLTTPGGLDETIRRLGVPVLSCARPLVDIDQADIDELCERMLATDTSIVPELCE